MDKIHSSSLSAYLVHPTKPDIAAEDQRATTGSDGMDMGKLEPQLSVNGFGESFSLNDLMEEKSRLVIFFIHTHGKSPCFTTVSKHLSMQIPVKYDRFFIQDLLRQFLAAKWYSVVGVATINCVINHPKQLSQEKTSGWLDYIGDCTTQLYSDYSNPLEDL